MFCPNCNSQNLATSVNCYQCGTKLIHDTEGISREYKSGAALIDRWMYSGIGVFLGFCCAVLLLKTVLDSLFINERLVCLAGMIVGSIVGRMVAWRKWRDV